MTKTLSLQLVLVLGVLAGCGQTGPLYLLPVAVSPSAPPPSSPAAPVDASLTP